MTPEEFDQFCKIAKTHGIKKVSVDGLHMEFIEQDNTPRVVEQLKNPEGLPTDDEMMLWSTDFMPNRKAE